MTGILDFVCAGCSVPFTIDLTGHPESSAAILRARSPELMCEPCVLAAEEAEVGERNRAAADKADEVYRRRIKDSRVPKLADGFQWPAGPAGDAARRWSQRHTLTLTIVGPVGTGKTQLAAAALRVRLRPIVDDGNVRSRRAAWRSMASYMAALDAPFSSPIKGDAAELAQGGVMLALDDIDKVTPTERAAAAVFAVVNAAVETRSPLLVTSNLALSRLAQRWPQPHGDAIASRLAEGDVVTLDGADRRVTARRTA